MRRPYPVPVEQLQAEMRQWTDAVLAARYAVPLSTMYGWRAQWGIPAHTGLRRRQTPGLQERLVSLLHDFPTGLTYRAWGAQLGISHQAAEQALKRLALRGVVRRHPETGRYCLVTPDAEAPRPDAPATLGAGRGAHHPRGACGAGGEPSGAHGASDSQACRR
jgi:hypothetical protein